jgi:putative MFS transporter
VITSTLINLGLMTAYYGIVLWAPTLLSQVQSITAGEASRLMIGFSVLAVGGRLFVARLADKIGRKKTGGYFALAAAVSTVLAGFTGQGDLFSPSFFWLVLLVAFLCADGSFAVCAVYSVEVWPARVRGSGSGYAGLTGSVGKILGPCILAFVVGSGNIVSPAATISVLGTAFGVLAAFLLVCGLTYLTNGIEASGVSDEETDGKPPRAALDGMVSAQEQ